MYPLIPIVPMSNSRTPPRGVTTKVAAYEWHDVLRSRWTIAYGLFFFAVTESLLWFGGSAESALISLINALLLIVPLIAIVFGTMYLYSARDFIELLLSQPVNRKQLYVGLYAGLVTPLSVAFVAGTTVPFVMHGAGAGNLAALLSTLVMGVLLTFVFVGFAFPIAITNDERVRGLGVALGVWLLTCLVYDGIVLLVLTLAADYPLEVPAIVMMLINPVDLARTLLLLQFDIAALMGYTGAVFTRFFGSTLAAAASLTCLLIWVAAPFLVGMAIFRRKDF